MSIGDPYDTERVKYEKVARLASITVCNASPDKQIDT